MQIILTVARAAESAVIGNEVSFINEDFSYFHIEMVTKTAMVKHENCPLPNLY